jgi:hypothetical protein
MFNAMNDGSFNSDYVRKDEFATPTTLEAFATQALLPYYQSL